MAGPAPAFNPFVPFKAHNFETVRQVGHGAFANVYLMRDKRVPKEFAVKIIKLDECSDRVETFQKETGLLYQCRSPFIVGYFGSFVARKELWIFLEFVQGGSVLHLVRTHGPLIEPICALICHDTLEGLSYLHTHGHLHLDIKPGNILVTLDGHCKLCDLGVAKGGGLAQAPPKGAADSDSAPEAAKMNVAGTLLYMSPEMVTHTPVSFNTDVWSLGISAIEMATGRTPRQELHQMKAVWMTAHNAPPTLEGKFSDSFKAFVALCLTKEAKDRPSAMTMLVHKFVKGIKKCSKLTDLLRRHRDVVDSASESDESSSSDEDEREPKWDFPKS